MSDLPDYIGLFQRVKAAHEKAVEVMAADGGALSVAAYYEEQLAAMLERFAEEGLK